MSRYFTNPMPQPKANGAWWECPPLVPHLTVDSHQAVYTGLVDASGQAIYRAPNPMGFGKDEEWQ